MALSGYYMALSGYYMGPHYATLGTPHYGQLYPEHATASTQAGPYSTVQGGLVNIDGQWTATYGVVNTRPGV